MRVLHILCDLSGGGAERLVLDLCTRSDADCEVATVQAGGALAGAFESAGVRVRCAERAQGRLGLRAVGRLARWSRDFDVVHGHLWAGDSWGRLGAALAMGPILVNTEHNIDAHEGVAKRRFKVGTARLLRRHIAVSTAVADWWVQQGLHRSRIEVVPNGVDLAPFAAPWVGGGPVVGLGRLVPQKGFDLLARAAASIDAPVHLAGEGPERARLEALLGDHGRCVGAVTDVSGLLRSASALVIPSRWEGFGLVAAEGLAAGVPIVTTAVHGLAEVVGEAALVVPAEDPAAIAAAVRRIQSEPGLAERLSTAGRTRAARFDVQRVVARYDQIYRELVG